MNHKEKTELLQSFARGVETNDSELLQNTFNLYNSMVYVSIARQMQRENYQQIINTDDELIKERLITMNGTLEKVKDIYMKDNNE